MNTAFQISVRSEQRWSRRLLEVEVEQLKREREHLLGKAGERELTRWETERLESLVAELGDTVRQLREISGKH